LRCLFAAERSAVGRAKRGFDCPAQRFPPLPANSAAAVSLQQQTCHQANPPGFFASAAARTGRISVPIIRRINR